MIIDNFLLALKNIRERKTRVFLTLLGIAIGIMAIVSLMSLGEGMQQAVTQELSTLSDTIIVTIGGGFDSPQGSAGIINRNDMYFSDRDIGDIQRIQGIKDISPLLSSAGLAQYNGINYPVSLVGMTPDNIQALFGLDSLGLESGSFINTGDQNKVIIGYNVAHEFFDTDVPVGGRIIINDKKFFVSGIYKKEGMGFSLQTDDSIHMTQYDFEKLTGQKNSSIIIVKVYDVNQVNTIADDIETVINENHGSDDFVSVTTMDSILDSIQNVLSIIQLVLLAIAAVALVVASIGIMNTMLTSVMERTHEIGIMKAIGAQNIDIMGVFLFEGLLISLIGGITGITIGIIGANGFTFVTAQSMGAAMGLSPVFTISSIVLAIGVALFVGLISSFYPARKAAKMSPIEAVRYE